MTKWWKDKVVYQIWPKSFYDGNGDGIGDLYGVIEKLDYLKELGIDMIWLSPVYASPLVDQGYDISDYKQINPLFGDMQTMDKLLMEMKKRDMKLIMDLVVNHCSSEHIWFQKACEDPEGKYGKYFYIRKKAQGRPSNVRAYFGGSVWDELPGQPDYLYYHSFHKEQPDLNWENEELRNEVYDMMNWWLAKGIAGFRVDAIINIKKRLPFRDYPVDREDGLSDIDHLVMDSDGIGEFLAEMKEQTLARYDAFSVGEVFGEKPEELAAFVGENGYFSSQFDFGPHLIGKHGLCHEYEEVTAETYKEAIFSSQERINTIGYLSNIIENHDEMRGVSRYIPKEDLSDTSKKALATVYFFLRGIPFIYQGQEIGMENCAFTSMDEIDDVSTINEYEAELAAGLSEEDALAAAVRYSRDNARTPMQWSAEQYAGFSTGKPWIKVNPLYEKINVAAEQEDPASVYHYYKAMIALRKQERYHNTLVDGIFEPYLPEETNLIAYYRRTEAQRILVMVNYQKERRAVSLPGAVREVLLNNLSNVELTKQEIILDGYQSVVLELE